MAYNASRTGLDDAEAIILDDLLKLGAEYEAARDAMNRAQLDIRQWAYDHPVSALNIGLLKLNYEAAIKSRRVIR